MKSFFFRPSLDSRGLFLFASNEKKIDNNNFDQIAFISEDIVLYQFINTPTHDDKLRITSEK